MAIGSSTCTPANSDRPAIWRTGETVTVYFDKTVAALPATTALVLCKVPHGAVILDGAFWVDTAAGPLDATVGTSASINCFAGTASGTTLVKFWNATAINKVPNYLVSVSDAVQDRFVRVIATMTASYSGVFHGWVSYACETQNMVS